jgi:alpha-beta hydrolase superfamily lysophospholipase
MKVKIHIYNTINMQSIVAGITFSKPKVSYNDSLSHLKFIKREGDLYSFYRDQSIYWIPFRYLHYKNERPTLLICHGNNEDIGTINMEALTIIFNINACVFDYAGYGMHSCTSFSEQNCQRDILAVYNHLVKNHNVLPDKLIIFGRAVGSATACYLAHHLSVIDKTPPLGLILVSPMMSAVKTLINIWLPVDMFMNYILAPHITCPTLILHGTKDKTIPYSCGKQLSLLFPHLYSFISLDNCDHNDIYTSEYHTSIRNFIHKL